MIGLFSALQEEVGGLIKEMTISRQFSFQGYRFSEGNCGRQDSLLVITGVGKERALKAAELALEKYPLSILISTGFGGALNAKTGAGDIVVCSGLDCGEEAVRGLYSHSMIESDARLVSASIKSLEGTGIHFIVGRGITLPGGSNTPEAKVSLGRKYTADLVDMESYWIGKMAEKQKLPFIEVRSIFDAVQDDISPLMRAVSPEGRLKPVSLISGLLSNPGQVVRLPYYARSAGKAQKNLGVFLWRFLEEIEKLKI